MRFLTEDEKELLQSRSLRACLLATIYLDEGVQRFCDDVRDLTIGLYTWIGANALFAATDIQSSSPLAAEGVSIKVDGTRAYNAGITDPAFLFSVFLDTDYHQRRFDLDWAFMPIDSQEVGLVIPAYAGKINSATLVDDGIDLEATDPAYSTLDIQLDALAMRYKRRSFRTRSHDDQLQLDPTDRFFSYVAGIKQVEESLYWGKEAPKAPSPTVPATGWMQLLGPTVEKLM